MTTLAYILENEAATFVAGDQVVMHSCIEAKSDECKNKIWTCETSSFKDRGNSDVVFLEDFSGYFLTDYLRKV